LCNGALPIAVLNGSDDLYLAHARIHALDDGRIWTGGPRNLPGGKQALFFNDPKAFNSCFRDFSLCSARKGQAANLTRQGKHLPRPL
jgi:hypothetical protein